MTKHNDKQHPLVQCPFYLQDDGRKKLVCEGITKQSVLAQLFDTPEDLRFQMEVFCRRDYPCCEICNMLMRNYEG